MESAEPINWHYEQYGEPSNPTLILLHGFAGSTESWAEHVNHFSKYYHTVVVDLLGHGKTNFSSKDKIFYSVFNESLLRLIETHTTFPRHILGYSMGGRVATRLLTHAPEKFSSVILISCGMGLSRDRQRKERIISDNILADNIRQNGMEWFVEYWHHIPLFATRKNMAVETLAKLTKIWMGQNPDELAKALQFFSVGNQAYILPQLSKLSVPILYMAGDHDSEYMLIGKDVNEILRNSYLTILENCGHDVPLEAPVQFRKKVLKFLDDSHLSYQS